MDKHRLQRLAHLFDTAVDLPTAARAAFIDAQAGDDATLRAELARLLARDERLASARTVSVVDRLATELPDLVAERDWRGVRVGQYELDEEIGRGGMGRVYRARRIDGAFDREVAVKLVARDALNPALLRRFSTERSVLAALDHPGICRLLDAGSADDGTPWVAMDLIRGAPITSWCDARGLDLEGRVGLFRKVLAAVSHAHRNLVVHRDIKPSNVLVDDAGQPHLLDFGIAKPLQTTEPGNPTATAERYFTLTHAAPEQWRGGPVTVACDVYALGVLLHELLAGAPPFEFRDLTPGRIEALILDTPAPPPSRTAGERGEAAAAARSFSRVEAWRRALRGDLDAIVQRALRKEADARYTSVEQFDADLAAWLEGRPVAARGGHGWYRARKFVGRHRVPVGILCVFTIALTTALATVVRQNQLLGVERDRAQSSLALLKSAFEAANPGQSAAGTTTAREVLLAAREELSAMRERRPEVYVDVGATIAEAQLALGHPDDALSLLDDVLPLIDHAQVDVSTGIAILNVRTLIAAGRYEEADAQLAIAGSLAASPGRLLALRGWLRSQQARYTEALADLEPAVALLANEPPTDPVATLARLQLGTVLRMLARPQDALALVDQTLSWQRAAGLSSAATADTRLRRVELLRVLGRPDEALAESKLVLVDAERVFGDRSMVTATALNGVGNVLGSLGRYPEAQQYKRRALEICLERVGPLHPSTIRTKFNLANSLARIPAESETASALFEEAIAGAAAVWGPRNRNTLIFRASWADLLGSRGRTEAALSLLLLPFRGEPPADARQTPRHFVQVLDRVRTRGCDAGSVGATHTPLCREADVLAAALAVATEAPR